MDFHVTLTNDLSGPAGEATSSMGELKGSIAEADVALKSFTISTAAAATEVERLKAAGVKIPPPVKPPAPPKPPSVDKKVAAAAKEKATAEKAAATAEKALGKDLAKKAALLEKSRLKEALDSAKAEQAAGKAVERQAKAAAKVQATADKEAAKGAKEADKSAKKLKSDSFKASADASKKRDKSESDMWKLAGKAGTAALAAIAVAGAGLSLAMPLALGYKGMAKMQMISAKLSLDVRKLFSGVDPTPFLRTLEKLEANFSKNTVTGRVMGDIISRVFNGLFAVFERLQPYIVAIGQGFIYAFLLLENGALRARIMLVPLTSSLSGLFSQASLCKIIFYGVAAAVGMVALSVGLLSIPIIFFVSAVTLAIKAYDKLKSLISGDTGKKAARGKHGAGAVATEKSPATDPAASASQGKVAGAALGDGLVAGMASKVGAVTAAGAALAKAADVGVKTEAQIKSPSRKMRKNAGYMGEGVVLGLKDSEGAVQKAAAKSLSVDVPKPSSGGSGASKGSKAGGGDIIINFNAPVGGSVPDFEAAVHRALTIAVHDVGMSLGVKVGP